MKIIFKSQLKTAVLFLFLAGFCELLAEAVPAMPGVFTHVQQDGAVVSYQLHGDEFLSYMTNEGGDLVAFGKDGDIYLARWAEEDELNFPATVPTEVKPADAAMGSLVSNAETARNPSTPIPQYLLERAVQAREKRDRSWREQFEASSDDETAAPIPRLK